MNHTQRFSLDGKVALVTGSWRGTGAGIAQALGREGCRVLVHGFEKPFLGFLLTTRRTNFVGLKASLPRGSCFSRV